jgi:hypothetical protein
MSTLARGAKEDLYNGEHAATVTVTQGKVTRKDPLFSPKLELGKKDDKKDIPVAWELPVILHPRPPANKIIQIEMRMPLGAEFKESADGKIVVVEVAPASNAYLAGVHTGDVLRATTCVGVQGEQADPERPGMISWLGDEGIGGEMTKTLFVVDGVSLAEVAAKIQSNLKLDGLVTLAVERI